MINGSETQRTLAELVAAVRRVEADMPRMIVDAIADRMKP